MNITPDLDPHTLSIEKKIELARQSDGLLIELLENETIDGSLNLYKCSSLTHLPEGLKVNGDLNLTGCASLTHLPEGLEVGGRICLPEHLK